MAALHTSEKNYQSVVLTGKKAGNDVGRAAVRSSGSFNISIPAGIVQGLSHRHCRLLLRADVSAGHINQKEPSVPLKMPTTHQVGETTLLLPALKGRVSVASLT